MTRSTRRWTMTEAERATHKAAFKEVLTKAAEGNMEFVDYGEVTIPQAAPRAVKLPKSAAHDRVIVLCNSLGIMVPVVEHRFHALRKWRFDYAWPERKLALEIEGGIWTNGAHTRGTGFMEDMEKYNEAALLGWRLLRFAPNQGPEMLRALRMEFAK